MGSIKAKELNIQLAAADIVKQLQTANAPIRSNASATVKGVQSIISKSTSILEVAHHEVVETLKKMDALPKELINMNEYNSLKSYNTSIPRKISEYRALGAKANDLVGLLSSVTTI